MSTDNEKILAVGDLVVYRGEKHSDLAGRHGVITWVHAAGIAAGVAARFQSANGRTLDYIDDEPTSAYAPASVLTHNELRVIEQGLTTGVPSDEQDASDVVDRHLHPTVERTFTVTVRQPTNRPPLTVADLTRVIAGDGTLHNSAAVNVRGIEEEN